MITQTNISQIRREYTSDKLYRSNLTNCPMQLFKQWLHQAYLSPYISDPTAMCLATADYTGQPYQRLVLLKHFTHKTMTFFTNLNSRKVKHLSNNPQVSICFPWNCIDKQIIVTGHVYQLSRKQVSQYFYKRPKNNQISTWVSRQSHILSSKKKLEKKFSILKKKYSHKKLPFPKFWGGYKIYINSMEFWQGGIHRLHDRFIYQKYHCNKWKIHRLFP